MLHKSCFFIGHREAPESLLSLLIDTVETHITEYGVSEFIVGHYGNFDSLAAQAVIAAKHRHPQVTLLLLLPYHPAERPISVPVGFDNTYFPPNMEKVPRRFAIIRANQYIIDHTDHLIAYVSHPASNAKNLLDYAECRFQQGRLMITNLALPPALHQR